jgi:integrase
MTTTPGRGDGCLAERDALLLMMAYRQGFRASELITLRWDQIDLKTAWLVQSDGRKIPEIVRRDPARRPTERNCRKIALESAFVRSPVPVDWHKPPRMRQFSATLARGAQRPVWLLEQTGFEPSSPLRCALM